MLQFCNIGALARHRRNRQNMIMVFRFLVAISFAAFALTACKGPSSPKPDLIILHTGRIRGNVVPVDLQSNAPLQHYPFLAGYIKAVREEARKAGAEVLLVDLGDSLSGSFASHVTGSQNMIEFFNRLGYDAICLSNLDFAVQPETLAQLKAPVLNPFEDETGQPATRGTSFATTIGKSNLQIGIAANFYGDTDPSEHPDRFPAWFGTTSGNVRPTRNLSIFDGLPEKGLRLLTWMKFESPEQPPAEFLEKLRGAKVGAILAHRIYGGKQREAWAQSGSLPWNPPVSMNILRENGGFAVARTNLRRTDSGWEILSQEIVPMTANTAPADPEIVEAISKFSQQIATADKEVCQLPAPMNPRQILDAYFDALLKEPGTQAAVYSLQSIRSDWPAGPLRASAVFNALPWTNGLVQVELPRQAVQQAAEELGLEIRFARDIAAETDAAPQLTVTTSEFFWRLLAGKLGLPLDAARKTGRTSEFDFFVEALAARPPMPVASHSPSP